MSEKIDQESKEPVTAVTTETKLGTGVKILLTALVVGSVVAGVWIALAIAQ